MVFLGRKVHFRVNMVNMETSRLPWYLSEPWQLPGNRGYFLVTLVKAW